MSKQYATDDELFAAIHERNCTPLRDYFAAKADIGDVDQLTAAAGELLLGRKAPDYIKDVRGCFAWWAEYRAVLRYIEADAMLKARAA